jgi:N,N'-diacetyllegionaminate synthase
MIDHLIIAEMANAHEGNVETAKDIARAASEAGASAIKFQAFKAEELAVPTYQHFGLYKKLEMPKHAWADLVDLSRNAGLRVYCDVFGIESAEMMNDLGVDGFMIHAADISNRALLNWTGALAKPILISAGGSTWIEIAEAAEFLRNTGNESIAISFGFQNFPTQLSNSHLRRISLLKSKLGLPVGFASHLSGDDPVATMLPAWAIEAGADLVEVHITLDRSRKGLDYFSSLEPAQFAEMVRTIRLCEAALGPETMTLSDEEISYRLAHRKCVVSTREVRKGESLTEDNVGLRRANEPPPGRPVSMERVLGRRITKDLPAYTTIKLEDMRMKAAATLACRTESIRLYGKPMQMVGNQPIIQHLIDRLRRVKSIDEIVLAITEGPSSALFIDYAKKQALPYVLGPEKDVLKRLIMAGESVKADIVVRVTPDNPFIYWENLDDLIARHIARNADLTVTEKLPLGAIVEVISLDALQRSHTQGEDRHRSELCTLFISENPDLFDIQRVSVPARLQRPDIRLTVDTPYDLILVRTLWEALRKEDHLITIEEIIDFIDAHPEVSMINKTGEQTLHLWK